MIKKLGKSIDHNKVVAACLQAVDVEGRKEFYRELNNVLIKELDVDYSSFFLNAGDNLNLYETNIRSDILKSEIESIISFSDPEGEDFKKTFEHQEIIFMERGTELIYPTAKHRHIRSAMCMPLEGIGYWFVEDSRKLGSDDFLQSMAKISKNLERIIRLHAKSYLNATFNIPTFMAIYNECRDIARSVIVLDVINLQELINNYGVEVRKDLMNIVIQAIQSEKDLKGGIGIRSDDLLIICSMQTPEKIKSAIERAVSVIEGYRLTIDSETVCLKLRHAVGTTDDFNSGALEVALRRPS